MKLNWMVLCEKIIVDARSNNPSLIGLFTTTLSSAEGTQNSFAVAVSISELLGETPVLLKITKPDSKELVSRTSLIPAGSGDANLYFEFRNQELPSFGIYKISLSLNNAILGEAIFEFRKME